MRNFLRHLSQPSTVRGLVLLAGTLGVGVSPENVESIMTGVAGVLGVYETLRNGDKKR